MANEKHDNKDLRNAMLFGMGFMAGRYNLPKPTKKDINSAHKECIKVVAEEKEKRIVSPTK